MRNATSEIPGISRKTRSNPSGQTHSKRRLGAARGAKSCAKISKRFRGRRLEGVIDFPLNFKFELFRPIADRRLGAAAGFLFRGLF
jgi:hypothetical protein